MDQIIYQINGTNYIFFSISSIMKKSTIEKIENIIKKYNCILQSQEYTTHLFKGIHVSLKILVPENNIKAFNENI